MSCCVKVRISYRILVIAAPRLRNYPRIPQSRARPWISVSRFRIPGASGCGSQFPGFGFRVPGPGFRIPRSGFRAPDFRFRVPGFGLRLRLYTAGCRVSRLGFMGVGAVEVHLDMLEGNLVGIIQPREITCMPAAHRLQFREGIY